MKKNSKLRFILPFFLVCSLLSYCQNQKTEKREFVKSFFEDIFIKEEPLEQISKEYRYKGSKIKSEDEAIEMFKSYITYLKTTKKHLLKKGVAFKIDHYNDCSIKDLWIFEKKERKNIFVVSVEGEIVTYVLLKKNKIFSFLYFRKGSESTAYFIPYYAKQEF
ncbi:hypothetical protein [Aquimarina sp. Aq78]|uniref:hypothetical protein n=1 Tax=Aquimarina sp. Aq78 TaxID=1191889 RepID=UPI000D0F1CD6|nr:hypothetical protein [Aquimarina sp. Aq78]